MRSAPLVEELMELESAEEFLEYFAIPFDPAVVQVNRLHILQRFHDYLDEVHGTLPPAEQAKRDFYASLLHRAYEDFTKSDALTEKVFKVFHRDTSKVVFIPPDQILKR